jgi:hypothetical protein
MLCFGILTDLPEFFWARRKHQFALQVWSISRYLKRKRRKPLRVLLSAGRAAAGCKFVVNAVFWDFN